MSAYQTDVFKGVAAASPSMWFPGFSDYMKEQDIKAKTVYLSLGDKEERTRNPVMATVADKIREAYRYLKTKGGTCTLEWNPGNHFPELFLTGYMIAVNIVISIVIVTIDATVEIAIEEERSDVSSPVFSA